MSEIPCSSISYAAIVNIAGYKILIIRLLYLCSEFGVDTLGHQGAASSSIFKILDFL